MNSQEPRIETRLESWKEIGAYLQRDSTTARRWEKEEGLPVHRHSHKSRSSVYAYPSEIDAWRASRKVVPEPPPVRTLWRWPVFALTMLLCLMMVGNGIRPASAQQPGGGFVKRLVCASGCGDNEANLSPDAHWMVKTDWDSGDLAIRDMSTGQITRLLAKPGDWDSGADADSYAESPVFSPDLSQIAYLWEVTDNHAQLRLMPNQAGAKSRVLMDNPENIYYRPAGWSQDGKSVLVFVEKPDKTWQLAWVLVADGTVKPLVSLGWRSGGDRLKASLSPDGRYIAYAAMPTNPKSPQIGRVNATEVRIYVVAADGSSGADLVKTAGVNDNPTWAIDGKHLLFTSNRSGNLGLWSLAVEDGKPAGSPKLVSGKMDIGAVGMRSGSYYYTQNTDGIEEISIVEMGSNGAGRISDSFVGQAPAWSPDGKSVAFKRHHPGKEGAWDLVVHSIETGDERTYTTSIGVTGGGSPWWFHDGRSILSNVFPPGLLYRVDLESGEFKETHAGPAGPSAISLDDKALYAVRPWPTVASMPAAVIAVDFNSGQERQVVSLRAGLLGNFIKLSPDGRTLALVRYDPATRASYVIRVGVDGRDYREIYSIPQGKISVDIAWTKDGSGILLNKQVVNDKREIIRIPAEGGMPQTTGIEISSSFAYMDLSPDGSRLAFSGMKGSSELWALDNVLSALK